MQQTLRPYVTAGVALVGAGMIAVAPVAAHAVGIQAPDVALTSDALDLSGIPFSGSGIDWGTQFGDLLSNATASFDGLADGVKELFTAIAAHPTGLFTDIGPLFDALTFLGGDHKTFLQPLSDWTLNSLHQLAFETVTAPGLAGTLLDFSASPLSGLLAGGVDPFIAPFAALATDVQLIIGDLIGTGSGPLGALETLINLPVDVLLAPFNGAPLDISGLADIAFGGLLSPGEVIGSGSLLDPATDAGGSIFNAIGLLPAGGSIAEGVGVGPFGALAGLSQVFAEVLNGTVPTSTAAVTLGALPGLDFGSLLGSLGTDLSSLFGGEAAGAGTASIPDILAGLL